MARRSGEFKHTVLAAIAFDDAWENVVAHAVAHARPARASVVLLHVLSEPAPVVGRALGKRELRLAQEALREDARKRLAAETC